MATFVVKCDKCATTLHKNCVLSLLHGTIKLCVKCFEAGNYPATNLDDHMVTPFSPNNEIPCHAFTRNYSAKLNLLEAMQVTIA